MQAVLQISFLLMQRSKSLQWRPVRHKLPEQVLGEETLCLLRSEVSRILPVWGPVTTQVLCPRKLAQPVVL